MENRRCLNPACPSYGTVGSGSIIHNGFYRTRSGKRRRYRCGECGKTFSSTKGTLCLLFIHPRALNLISVLETAWAQVRRNKGAPGVDGVTIDQIVNSEDGSAQLIEQLQRELREKNLQSSSHSTHVHRQARWESTPVRHPNGAGPRGPNGSVSSCKDLFGRECPRRGWRGRAHADPLGCRSRYSKTGGRSRPRPACPARRGRFQFLDILPIEMTIQGVKSKLRLLLGLLVQLVSQSGEFLWYLLTCSPFWRSVHPIPGHHHRVVTQSILPSSYTQLANGRAPSLHGSYPASSLLCAPPTPAQAAFRLCLPLGVGFHPPDGSPRFLCQSVDTRCPQPPRMAPRLHSLILLPWITGFGTFDILGRPSISVTRLNRVHLRYGSRLCLRRLRPLDCSKSPLLWLHVV